MEKDPLHEGVVTTKLLSEGLVWGQEAQGSPGTEALPPSGPVQKEPKAWIETDQD